MPVPSFQTLYNFEDQIESAVASAISAAIANLGMDETAVQILTSRDLSIKSTPRIEISFSLTGAMTQRSTFNQAVPKETPNAFEGSISVILATTRPEDATAIDMHGPLTGAIRYAMSAPAQVFTSGNLPNLQIMNMLPENQSSRVFDEKEQDLKSLGYHIWFAIQNSAWDLQPGLILFSGYPLLLLN